MRRRLLIVALFSALSAIAMGANPMPIQLSTGVALAQTGPDGTLMSFGATYEFQQGEPAAGGYIWVIERSRGPAAKLKVTLKTKGELLVLVPGWKPEDGPFRSHLEDRQGKKLSDSIAMQTVGG